MGDRNYTLIINKHAIVSVSTIGNKYTCSENFFKN